MKKLAPSILSADFARLEEDVRSIASGGAHLIHVDVMDGHFVPNISFGATVMKSLEGKTDLPFDVHLMIEEPDRYIEDFMTEKTEFITVHQEACVHLNRTVDHIRSLGCKAGVSINPATPVALLEDILPFVDLVLVMSVNPGFGGQKLIGACLDKVRALRKIRDEKGLDYQIEIDGGVTLENLREVAEAGTDIIVAGSAVFKAENIEATVREFCSVLEEEA